MSNFGPWFVLQGKTSDDGATDAARLRELRIEQRQEAINRASHVFRERSRLFLILLGVLLAGTIIRLRTPSTETILELWLADAVGQSDASRLRNSLPFSLIETLLLATILYLMVNLYHRAIGVLRNYHYIAALEHEIRTEWKLGENGALFTQESTFYWRGRPRMLGAIKWLYIAMLGILLDVFLASKLASDIERVGEPNFILFMVVDSVLSLATLTCFVVFAIDTRRYDRPLSGEEIDALTTGRPASN